MTSPHWYPLAQSEAFVHVRHQATSSTSVIVLLSDVWIKIKQFSYIHGFGCVVCKVVGCQFKIFWMFRSIIYNDIYIYIYIYIYIFIHSFIHYLYLILTASRYFQRIEHMAAVLQTIFSYWSCGMKSFYLYSNFAEICFLGSNQL